MRVPEMFSDHRIFMLLMHETTFYTNGSTEVKVPGELETLGVK